ncbi:MAG: primosomal protein N' [Chloroflexota bacterium]|nr:primosomal protein N' [Chloroflexota bacterium]
MEFAEIAVNSPTGHSRTFSYSVPRDLSLSEGHSVLVPFGQQILQGIVFSVDGVASVENTRDVLDLTDEQPFLDETRLSLARWISEHYMCTLFDAAALMIPPGGRTRNFIWLSSRNQATEICPNTESRLSDFQRDILEHVSSAGRVRLDRLILRFGQNARSAVGKLVDLMLLDRETVLQKSQVKPRFLYVPLATKLGIRTLKSDSFGRSFKQKELVATLASDKSLITMAEARSQFGSTVVKAALDKGFIEQRQERLFREPLEGRTYKTALPVKLNDEQQLSVKAIVEMLDKPHINPRSILLYGVTGSGKTEVYLDSVQHCLERGKKALVLVPEIALTPQTIERFASRFPGEIAVMHSGLSLGERFDQWWKIRGGEYNIVIGSRGAVFAPQPDLGLVVIDEEHEWTYKQNDSNPKYHARDVAMQLAGVTRAAVILGSASPDIESYIRARRERYRFAKLTKRFLPEARAQHGEGMDDLATVKVVDMREELRKGNRDIFSDSLHSAIDETISRGEQIILFLNRRGSSSFSQCRSCGYVLQCGSCDIALTFHSDDQRLACHYCGRRRRLIYECPSCKSDSIGKYGIGTQAVAERIRELFPEVNVIRWDRDAATNMAQYEDILKTFRSGCSQILVGTQLIAKGHHLPGVTLVGVISADTGLGIPDFRAGERAFQVLCQVAGRAGRGEYPGRVIIQTYQPDHYAIIAAAKQDYLSFYEAESSYRRMYAYPPYSRLIRLVYQHTNKVTAEHEAHNLSETILNQKSRWGISDTDVIGPTPTFPSRLRGSYRWQIILRGPNPRSLLDKVYFAVNNAGKGKMPRGWFIDIDPVSFN